MKRRGTSPIDAVIGTRRARATPRRINKFVFWSFAVLGGLRRQVGGVLAGFAGFRANPTENAEALARATSGGDGTLKLQFVLIYHMNRLGLHS